MNVIKCLAVALALSMLTIGLVPLMGSAGSLEIEQPMVVNDRLVIDGDADLASQASTEDWPGTGTANDPYVIKGLNIVSDENLNAIDIKNVSSHILLDGCSVSPMDQQGIVWESYSCGISLQNVSNIVINGTAIDGFVHGVMTSECSNVVLANSTVSGAASKGVRAVYSDNLTFENNTITNNAGSGLEAHSSSNLLVQCNNVSYNEYTGLDFWLPITDSLIRWNIVSSNGWYGGGNALYISGTGNTIYGNVLVGYCGADSMPAVCGYGAINDWSSPDGVGNYYGDNYDAASGTYTSFIGDPICSTEDENGDGISDEPYTIPCSSSSYEGGPEVDSHPLILPAAPPRDLTASVLGDEIELSWSEPAFFTDPIGHYILSRDNGSIVQEHIIFDTNFVDSVEDFANWESISYTIVWAGRHIISGPSNAVEGRNPDRPVVSIISELGVHMQDGGSYTNSTIDPRFVTVEWVGADSDSSSMDYQVRLDDGEWVQAGAATEHTFTDLLEGMHTVTVRATDNGLNQVEDSRTFCVYRLVQMDFSCFPVHDGEGNELLIEGIARDAVTGDPIADLPMVLLYSTEAGQSWDAADATTDGDGNFELTIELELGTIMGLVLAATLEDHYQVERSFFHNETYAAMDLNGREGLFLARSTSRLTDFTYSSELMHFNVTGDEGTIGSTSILIPKSGMTDADGITICLDGEEIEYELHSEGDFWVLTFEYTHSTHEVEVDLGSAGSGTAMILVAAAALAVVAAVAIFLVLRRRRKG